VEYEGLSSAHKAGTTVPVTSCLPYTTSETASICRGVKMDLQLQMVIYFSLNEEKNKKISYKTPSWVTQKANPELPYLVHELCFSMIALQPLQGTTMCCWCPCSFGGVSGRAGKCVDFCCILAFSRLF